MLKIGSNPYVDLDVLVDAHLAFVNGKVKSGARKGQWKENSITSKLNTAINLTQGDENLFLKYLLNTVTVDEIIKGTPVKLESICNEIDLRFPNLNFFTITAKTQTIRPTDLGKMLYDIFDYTAFRKSQTCISTLNAYGYARAVPCVYCNLDDVCVVPVNSKSKAHTIEKALLDMDHFFAKYKYPFLALSFYNLIPSCHNCNSRYKGYKDFLLSSHVHPFVHNFDDIFKFELSKAFDPSQTEDDIVIKVKNKVPFGVNSVEDLGLIERYQAYRFDLLNVLQIMYKNLKRTKSINDLFGSPNDTKDVFELAKIPLTALDIATCKMGKLKRDLLADVGVI